MSSISSISNNSYMTQSMGGHRRHDPAAMAEKLFSKLDSSGQGYIQETDLASALSSLNQSGSTTSSSTDTSASELFKQLDTNSDGKVTKDEFTSSVKKLAEQLDQQFMSMRLQEGMQGMGQMGGGMPPPPPGGHGGDRDGDHDGGFTKDELSSQLQQIGSSDSTRSAFISNVVNNFDKADTNGDGKVSFKEALTLNNSTTTTTSGSTASTGTTTADTSTSATSQSSDTSSARLMLQIMRLMHAYGSGNAASVAGSVLSVAG